MRREPVRGEIVADTTRASTASTVVAGLHTILGYSTGEAVTFAVPGLRVVITPLAETVATTSSSLVHVNGRPVFDSTLFAVSRNVTVGCVCCVTVNFCDVGDCVHEPIGTFVTVTDAELIDYLGKDAPTVPALRELARRDLTIQKLRESVVLQGVHVNDAEIDAWLTARTPPGERVLQGTLRTLRFASYPEAMRVRQEIVAKRLPFDQAEAAYGADSFPDAPGTEDLEALPPQVVAAAKALTPGSVSQPLPFESSVLLFILAAADDPSALLSRRREGARKAIALDKSEAVAEKLLDDLRGTTTVVRHVKELPFGYVADDTVPHAK